MYYILLHTQQQFRATNPRLVSLVRLGTTWDDGFDEVCDPSEEIHMQNTEEARP